MRPWANRLVVVVSDGTAVLGLGDIGAAASLPVMEGKSALFKTFGGLDSIPLVLDTKDPDEIVETLIRLRPSFGAVNLEDISAPRCFEIERRLIEALDCPVMHDDQHGTAIVVLAALLGAAKVLDRDINGLRVVIAGAGAAGVACANILLAKGISDITVLDSKGIVHSGRSDLNAFKAELAERTNPAGRTGGVAEALDGADMFLGLSAGVVPDMGATLDVIERSSGQSWIGSDRMRRAIGGDLAPRAHVTLLEKDTRLAVEAARAAGFEGPLGARAAAVFAQAHAAGLAALDDGALLGLLRGQPGDTP